jgi:hypothetical protein
MSLNPKQISNESAYLELFLDDENQNIQITKVWNKIFLGQFVYIFSNVQIKKSDALVAACELFTYCKLVNKHYPFSERSIVNLQNFKRIKFCKAYHSKFF